MAALEQWRTRNKLTQVEAAALLGVSQTYVSLLEMGARPLTAAMRSRMRWLGSSGKVKPANERFRRQLSALGYPPFRHFERSRTKPRVDALLLSMLGEPDLDARTAESLPWLVGRFEGELNLDWLVRQTKLRNLQNRLGFVLALAGAQSRAAVDALEELERARLLEEATLGWDTMPEATRRWMRSNRSDLAKHWNILTRAGMEDTPHAA